MAEEMRSTSRSKMSVAGHHCYYIHNNLILYGSLCCCVHLVRLQAPAMRRHNCQYGASSDDTVS